VPPVTRYDGSQVARRPGESADAWRSRTAAFQTRYAYSRAALERGDFAAAAGGFEAILQEEPGYLDVPQLLVRARAGLRDVARDVYEAGQRLDAAGDWLGALEKYEQAGQLHPDVRGLPDSMKRVREKLRTAGEEAFTRARRFDDSGRWADALKEYEKAVQWLPSTDPRWEMAQSRVELIKKSAKE
jgi:tetratricopeptide (TPR) repeat protein